MTLPVNFIACLYNTQSDSQKWMQIKFYSMKNEDIFYKDLP